VRNLMTMSVVNRVNISESSHAGSPQINGRYMAVVSSNNK